jgi:hypothetical protein
MFSILEVDSPEWASRLEALPPHLRDAHFYPHMLAPYMTVYGWAAKAALTVSGEDFIIQPFLVTHDGQIRHAYNFGGPIGTVDADDLADPHAENLMEWAIEHGGKAEFCTLNPFLCGYQLEASPPDCAKKVKDTVYIDLIHIKPRGTTRRLANKAQGAGVRVNVAPNVPGTYRAFNAIYTETMDRAQAQEYWYTPPNFFQELCEWTGGVVMLAEYEGGIEAGCVIVPPPTNGNGVAYYHYAGSYNSHPNLGINHMMVLAAAEYCKSQGHAILHLGGGLTPDPKDGLYVFKAGFSDLRAPVYTYKRSFETQAAA